MENNNILLVAFIQSHLEEMIKIAKFLKQKSFNPVILYIDDYMKIDFSKYKEVISKDKIRIITILGVNVNVNSLKKIKIYDQFTNGKNKNMIKNNIISNKIASKFLDFCFDLKVKTNNNIIIQSWEYYKLCINKISIINNIYQKFKPSLVIFNEENLLYFTNIYSKIAKDNKIPSIIIPHAICEDTGIAENAYSSQQTKISIDIIKYIFPQWLKTYKKRTISMMPLYQILILSLLKLSPQKPWIINDGFSDAIAVESQFMMKYYKKIGVDQSKLILTGSLADDILYNKNNKPIIVCALPSPQYGRLNYEFKEYTEILNFMIQGTSKQKQYNVIFSPHPHITGQELDKLKNLQINITKKNIAELISESDIFIASISSTIRWAIAAGVPVINYDVYRFHYRDFDTAKGVVTVEKKEDFEKVLKKITTNKKYYKELKEKQEKCAPDWGMLDGKSGERILKLIDQLINEKKND